MRPLSERVPEYGGVEMQDMTESDYVRTLDELDRLLNDPDVPMQPSLIWRLLDKVSEQDVPGGNMLSRIMAPGRETGPTRPQ